MRRINFGLVWKTRKFLVQTVVHHCGHHLRCVALAARQIRTAHIPYEECVTSEHLLWLIGDFSVDHDDGDAFRCVTRCFHKPEHNFSHPDFVAFSHRSMREGDASFFAKDDFRTGALRKLSMATNEIRVKMGL